LNSQSSLGSPANICVIAAEFWTTTESKAPVPAV
jgi:hypothetical protein